MNPRLFGYEPNELPDCSTPRYRKSSFETMLRSCMKGNEIGYRTYWYQRLDSNQLSSGYESDAYPYKLLWHTYKVSQCALLILVIMDA